MSESMRYTLYGTLANTGKVVAYCRKHKAGITAQQLKQKQCLAKQCRALKKYPEHPYWVEREQKKRRKKVQDD